MTQSWNAQHELALAALDVQVLDMQEIAADFPSLSHRYIVGIHELYGQVGGRHA